MLQLQLIMLLLLHLSMKLQFAVINDAAIAIVNIAAVVTDSFIHRKPFHYQTLFQISRP